MGKTCMEGDALMPNDEKKAQQLAKLEGDLKRVEKETKGIFKAGAGGQVRRKKGAPGQGPTSRVMKGTAVSANKSNVWRQVDASNLAASAAKVWAVYDTNKNGTLSKKEVRVMVKDWITAMPDICSVYFDDALSVEEMRQDIEVNADKMTTAVMKWADADKNGTISKEEWVSFFQ